MPSLEPKAPPPKKSKKSAPDSDDDTENLNQKNDRELQQFLAESHLLDLSSSSGLGPTGKNRHKAIDLRLQSLGSKSSVFKEEKMPMAFRKGIVAKSRGIEEERRKQAKENNIILERPQMKGQKSTSIKKRERSVGDPSVGKFRGGTLNLSKHDIKDIVGSRGKGGKGGKQKGKRR